MSVTTVTVRYIVDDVSAAVAFYTAHLGFTVEIDAAPGFAAVERDGLRLLLSATTPPATPSSCSSRRAELLLTPGTLLVLLVGLIGPSRRASATEGSARCGR
ncbi:MAG: VOC family protein [Pseudonocardiaceae bacterium]